MDISKEEIKCIQLLSGEMESNQERSMFEINLLLDDDIKETYQDYKLLWDSYPKPELSLQKERYAKKVMKEIQAKGSSKIIQFTTTVKVVCAIAASFILGVGFYILIGTKTPRYTNHIIAGKGERKEIALPDGSVITLNSGAELKYPEHFKGNTREVWFKGEGYFNISKNPEQPFKVSTSDGFIVEVLGTKFNVDASTAIKTVSLESGKVAVTFKESGDTIRLTPDEELSWNSATGEVIKRMFDVTKTTSWKDNILLLDNIDLRTALQKINTFYGVAFTVSDATIAQKKINAAFENQNLDKFIATLEFIADVKVTATSSNQYIITPADEK